MERINNLIEEKVENFRQSEIKRYNNLEMNVQKYKEEISETYHSLINQFGPPNDDISGKKFYIGERSQLSKSTQNMLCQIYQVSYITPSDQSESIDLYGDTGVSYWITFGPKIQHDMQHSIQHIENDIQQLERSLKRVRKQKILQLERERKILEQMKR